MVDNTKRQRREVVDEVPERPQRAELEREAMAVAVATTAQDLGVVGVGQRPVARQFLVGRIAGGLGIALLRRQYLGGLIFGALARSWSS